MNRAYYSDTITRFLARSQNEILGELGRGHTVEASQNDAWIEEIRILQSTLGPYRDSGSIYFEYSIPRLGKRIDVLLLIKHVIFLLEFKVGEDKFSLSAIDQVWDYALDLKNFHETSHIPPIAPIVIPTRSAPTATKLANSDHNDHVMLPIRATPDSLSDVITQVLNFAIGPMIDASVWEMGRYHPTPTIVEAAMALYNGHSVQEITRKDASAINLAETSQAVSEIIETSRNRQNKSICFVTGVPGAGKTLVGLNIATDHIDKKSELYSVFLSGNDPLVAILREALARDKVRHERELGRKVKKDTILSEVKAFIQNVHHFRDECLIDNSRPPNEHVAIFDEAQRAWTREQTSQFMRRRKNQPNFDSSEPKFLISCLNRHKDWAVIVCLVGGGQEINKGEAGISEWIQALTQSLTDSEYSAGRVLDQLASRPNVTIRDELHLAVSMRSFRAENVSLLVKQLLDLDVDAAQKTLLKVSGYPIVITRDLVEAKRWLRRQARGSERYGIVASSKAQRLKPYAIDVRSPIDPVHWFLDGKEDVRSSYYLEDVATEFQVQGLELDWACVVWDGNFRYTARGWDHRVFKGKSWSQIKQTEQRAYLKNAYRVLLTRARQGMVIVVPHGDAEDCTRKKEYYDATFDYLSSIGFGKI